ncbi:helix-turn-helix domain-containing protein [Phaeocystidibacter luteus]|uniref:Helix-turn-helix domain-containing protein n=1 Tax=Phaeocystidibacter luteus TaxID=911197 RepID=A0A6N6RJP5_9FLAO|nr:helix-turn-helix domain-containing protein [Phaeocystidibacter luteus]KAB2813947.1 helix-turn-helix domain-containing protein [Phaeocystidibacter luteus]
MTTTTSYHKPTKAEQKLAQASYQTLAQSLKEMKTKSPEVEIEETQEKMKIPLYALQLLAEILDSMSKGKPISIVPLAAELTTQAAAEHLGCSRPHLVKLLENGEIPFTLVGRHRRVKFDDVMKFKEKIKKEQKAKLIEIMKADEEAGLYDS